ncbi:vomeronasal type-2 receptor 26-like [Dendrobates tinctorius]|uniref:vomeronasal type-2 receptor 26-like n=1 Tax=Dendrobates tinctorius TaxID=92724 RepID=UPI003CC973D0
MRISLAEEKNRFKMLEELFSVPAEANDRVEITFHSVQREASFTVPAEQENCKHVTQRSGRMRRQSTSIPLKNRYQTLTQDKYEAVHQESYFLLKEHPNNLNLPTFLINDHLIQWKTINNEKPKSQCTKSCLPGSRKVPGNTIYFCCYGCIPCSEGEKSNTSDNENCRRCPDHEWSNENKTQCVPKLVEFLSYSDHGISLTALLGSILLLTVTAVILGIFVRYQDTPIVRANNKNLSFILLVSIMLSFLCVFLFLGRPVDGTCMLHQICTGLLLSISISSLLAKTIMVYIAFKATKPGSVWRTWTGVKLPNCVLLICSSIQGVICMSWVTLCPPFQELDTHTHTEKIIVQCNEGSDLWFYSVLGYMGILAAVSFITAFLARTLPDSFNEAKYITFSMLVFCSVWIAMIPAYFSTRGKYTVAVEIFAILTSNAGLLGCIFFPKCYIILCRPEQNTKSYIMSRTA